MKNPKELHAYDEIEDFFKRLFARSLHLDLGAMHAGSSDAREGCEACALHETVLEESAGAATDSPAAKEEQ